MIGLLISSLAKNADWALYIFPLALIPQLLLAGLLVPVEARHPFAIRKPPAQVQSKEDEVHCLDQVGSQGYCMEPGSSWLIAPEMNPILRYGASPFMAARWGLEALTDMYVHDYTESNGPDLENYSYSFKDLGAVYVTFHDDDEKQIGQDMRAMVTDKMSPAQLSSNGRSSVLAPYLMVLGGFAVTMLLLTMAALKRKDYEVSRL